LSKTYIVYSWTVKKRLDEKFMEAWRDFAAWAVGQNGSSGSTRLFRDLADTAHFMSVDSWENEDAIADFQKGAEFRQRIGILRELLDDFSFWPLELKVEAKGVVRGSL
jgi:heme-degrading monooxygenase HmoA